MPHPDVALERARLRFAQECLEAMRRRTAARVADEDVLAANEADAEAVKWQLQRRLASLDDDAGVAVLRPDRRARTATAGTSGAATSRTATGAPVVVDWRAAVATPFYRATLADPLGLRVAAPVRVHRPRAHRRLRGGLRRSRLARGSGGVPDPLLAELGRARTGQMRDIVATIQAEQDAIIRAPLERCLVVQGGPGTGKTAVGLHRAAFLLYEHRALLRARACSSSGPNPVFLRYISQVLPSLGETSATQTTVDGCFAALPGRRRRSRRVAAVKGDARMATVIARARGQTDPAPRRTASTLTYRARRLELSHAELERPRRRRARRDVPVIDAAPALPRALVRPRTTRTRAAICSASDEQELGDRAARRPRDRKAVDGCWRSVNAVALVRSAAHAEGGARRAADGVLDDDEQALILRPRADAEAWTAADLPLLDEAEALVKGAPRRFEHVVVDEAQDLSPMQLRMLARRARRHSMTVLGDLAQATGPASPRLWDETLVHLGRPANAERAELTMGYRLPGAVLDLANRLLPYAAADVAPSRSVRDAGDPPDLHRVDAGELVDAVAEHACALAKEFATVAVIADPARVDADRAPRSKRAASCSPNRARSRPTIRSWSCPRRSRRASSSTR